MADNDDDDDDDVGIDEEIKKENAIVEAESKESFKRFKQALKTLYGKHKKDGSKHWGSEKLGRNWQSRFLVTMAYYYVILLSIGSVLGPLQNLWVPHMTIYSFYPVGILIGSYIGYVWTHESFFLVLQAISGFLGFITSLVYVIEYGYQSLQEGGFNSVIYGTPVTTVKYPPTTWGFYQNGTFDTTGGLYNPAYLVLQISLNSVNLVICFLALVFSLGGMLYLKKEDSSSEYRKYEFKTRIFVTGLSFFLVIVCLSGYFIIGFVQLGDGLVLLNLFSNQNVLLMTMMTLSIYPPMGDGEIPKTEEGKKPDEEHQRYYSVRDENGYPSIDEKAINFFFGWIFAFMVSIWAFSFNGVWRGKNSMPVACGPSQNYTKYLGNITAPGESLTYFVWQQVSYQPTERPEDVMSSYTITCIDDVVNLVLLSVGMIIFLCSLHVVCYGLCPKCLRKDIQKREKKESIVRDENVETDIKKANKKAKLRWVGFANKNPPEAIPVLNSGSVGISKRSSSVGASGASLKENPLAPIRVVSNSAYNYDED